MNEDYFWTFWSKDGLSSGIKIDRLLELKLKIKQTIYLDLEKAFDVIQNIYKNTLCPHTAP